MITVVGFFRRRPDLTHEQFSAHWREVHGPLIRDTPELTRHIRRYVQHHVSPCRVFPGLSAIDYDGFSEISFDSVDAFRQMRGEPIYGERVIPDLHEFLDEGMARTTVVDDRFFVIGPESF